MTHRLCWLALLLAALTPCRAEAQEHWLSVSVWSDLAPGTDFDAVEVALDGGAHAQPVNSAMDFEDDPQSVYSEQHPAGAHTLSVTLLLGTVRVVSRSMPLRLTADREIVVALDRCDDDGCAADCVAGECAPRTSTPPPRAVRAEIEASSTRGAARAVRAFDADLGTAWCPSSPGSTLTVRFAEPVTVRALTVRARPAQLSEDDDDPPPLPLTITNDAGTATTALPTPNGDAPGIALPSTPTRTLTFQAEECLNEIHIDLVDRAMVYGVPPEALASLDTTIVQLDRALLRCDARALTQLARFPVAFRETSPVDRGTYETESASTDRAAFRTARAIPCSWAAARRVDPPRPRPHPHVDQGIAPGVVRVLAGYAIEDVYWQLAWTRGRWRLVSIDSVFFE